MAVAESPARKVMRQRDSETGVCPDLDAGERENTEVGETAMGLRMPVRQAWGVEGGLVGREEVYK
jgi:hypothetical protein